MLRTFLYFVCLVPVLFDGSYAFKFSVVSQKYVLFPRTRLLQRLSFTNPLIPRRTVMSSSDRETETGKYLFHHCSRRSALISGFVFASMPTVVRSEGDSKLYKGPSAYGFEFRYPTGWLPNKKIGNRHLYDLEVRSPDSLSTISVTIDQISSNTLEQWSSLNEAAERLRAQYERQGDGRTAAIKSKRSEKDSSGLTFYTFEVALDNGALFLVKLTTTAQVEARLSVVSPIAISPPAAAAALCALRGPPATASRRGHGGAGGLQQRQHRGPDAPILPVQNTPAPLCRPLSAPLQPPSPPFLPLFLPSPPPTPLSQASWVWGEGRLFKPPVTRTHVRPAEGGAVDKPRSPRAFTAQPCSPALPHSPAQQSSPAQPNGGRWCASPSLAAPVPAGPPLAQLPAGRACIRAGL